MLAHQMIQDAADPLMRDAAISGMQGRELALIEQVRMALPSVGLTLWVEALSSATTASRRPEVIDALLAHLATSNPGWFEQAVLAGMSLRLMADEGEPLKLAQPPAVWAHRAAYGADAAPRFEQIAVAMAWPGHQPVKSVAARALRPAELKQFAQGRSIYATTCAACHGADGRGIKPLAPPLRRSEWVLGSADPLIRITLHGMEGAVQVGGVQYHPPDVLPAMPPLTAMNDADLAATLTYVRRAWSHGAEPVSAKEVGRVRAQTAGRTQSWTDAELRPTLNQH